jgi:hypothetical protein
MPVMAGPEFAYIIAALAKLRLGPDPGGLHRGGGLGGGGGLGRECGLCGS